MTTKKHPPRTHEVIAVPNRLKDKVGGGTGIPDDVLAAAEAHIELLAEDYRSWVERDLGKLRKALQAARAAPDDRASHLRELYTIAHDLKGQGTSFGYPLVTRIADALCRYLGHPVDADAVDLDICVVHVDALRVIIQNEITGDGGDLGRKVLDGIERVVEKSVASRS